MEISYMRLSPAGDFLREFPRKAEEWGSRGRERERRNAISPGRGEDGLG